ncbi:MAG: hypothetical protein ACRD4R_09045 [Candidatus Acidiferrales bacterium]
MTNQKISAANRPNVSRVEVYWHTVKYRTVVLYIVVIAAIILSLTYLVFPEVSSKVMLAIDHAVSPPTSDVATQSGSRQARFINLDGRVQVKKANSVQWVNADYQITLDKGDLVQTGPEGVARIVFADGTTYTVKGNTLVTVEENIVNRNRATQVGVHITSGQVDLLTGNWLVPGSKAQVSFENAVASVNANSRAAVVSDPKTNEQQITIDSGSAVLNRGDQHVDIGQYERATFPNKGGEIVKTQVLAPPELSEPLDLQPIIVADPKHASVHFAWKPSPTATSYEFQVDTTTMFNHVVVDRKTSDTFADATGLVPGDYFWRVRAIDDKGNVSDPSDSYKFILAAQGKEQQMLLDVGPPELEGNVVEVVGRTEPGAALIINGQQVADIQPNGQFRFFTAPMTRGSHTIVITGQNRRGGTAIKRVDVLIP